MYYRNQLILKNIHDRLDLNSYFLNVPFFKMSANLKVINVLEYGSKIQFMFQLLNNLFLASFGKRKLLWDSRILSTRKTKGKDKIRKFSFSPTMKLSPTGYPFSRGGDFLNLISVLRYFIRLRSRRVLLNYKILNGNQILINIHFLNNLFKFRKNKIILGSTVKRYNFHKKDSLSILLQTTQLVDKTYLLALLKQLLY